MSRNGKVIVAISGGVDSSVAACLLKEQGYDCVGVFMRVGLEATKRRSDEATEPRSHEATEGEPVPTRSRYHVPAFPPSHVPTRLKHGCCSVADALDARAIAGRLGIPLYVLNFERDFDAIISYFVDEYAQARTPNPCVLCNIHLKFGKLLRYADTLDAQFVATGHYARVLQHQGQPRLARSLNRAKDQSYVLFGIQRADLPRCLFPIGEIADKAEVRRIAADLGLKVHDKPDSQEICFVPDGDYKELVRARRPETQRPGEVRDAAGHVLGTHDGVANFTVGQRRGLGIATGAPIYVTRLNVLDNTVTVGSREELLSGGLVAERVNWLTDPPAAGEWRPATIKIRHTHTPASGAIRVAGWVARSGAAGPCEANTTLPESCVEARFDEPQAAVTPGQAAVFCDGEFVLGGGWIAHASPQGRVTGGDATASRREQR
ncbi:MAG: tRNA 2-thiouridine(34) synthase MnmA [Phycisphaerae bacterium]|nr:tRNA 2-thiouridine(34) synthase MnmA [Phycisphaerae bacterium]